MCEICEWEDFVSTCKECLENIEELPGRADDSRDSAQEKVESMQEWAEDKEHCTPKMEEALANIRAAVLRWLKHNDDGGGRRRKPPQKPRTPKALKTPETPKALEARLPPLPEPAPEVESMSAPMPAPTPLPSSVYFPCIVLDTETSGLPNNPHAWVLELAAVLYDAVGQEVAAFSSLVRPPDAGAWREDKDVLGALRVNGLSWDVLDRAPPRDVVLRAFAAWGSLAPVGTPITAYNLDFDRGMVQRTFPELTGAPWASFCVQKMARAAWRGPTRRFHLQSVAEDCGVERFTPAHRALSDARTAGALLRKMVEGGGTLRTMRPSSSAG